MIKEPIKKLGKATKKVGSYTDRDGKTHRRYQTIGLVFGTADHNKLCIKFNASATTDEQWANIYWDNDETEPPQPKTDLFQDMGITDEPVDLSKLTI